MCELINVTQRKEGDREFVHTVGSSFAPESVKQGAIMKIVGKPPRVAQINFRDFKVKSACKH
jgi:hypothetical protein